MNIKICTHDFNPWQEVQTFQQSQLGSLQGKIGATCLFVGTMRDFNDGHDVKGMHLEHYPGMTEQQLEKILNDSIAEFSVLHAFIVHRVGDIFPDEPIVAVAVWSSHRGDAFDACRLIMEDLKSKAPFWKKELLTSGEARWVKKNTTGYQKDL